MWMLIIAAALAVEPSVAQQSDGTIVARVVVAAPPDAVRAVLADPVACGKLAPEVLSVTSTAAGQCAMIDSSSRGAWSPLHWRSLRCPTPTGWRYDLVSSTDFEAMHTEWSVTDGLNGTTNVELRTHTELHLTGVPDAVISQGMLSSAKETLVRLVARVIP